MSVIIRPTKTTCSLVVVYWVYLNTLVALSHPGKLQEFTVPDMAAKFKGWLYVHLINISH